MKHDSSLERMWSTLARRTPTVVAAVTIAVLAIHADPACAQADPFATAKAKATEIQAGLETFATSVGMIGIICCLLLGYFNKLNWRWLATGIGVSFAIGTVPGFVRTLASFGG